MSTQLQTRHWTYSEFARLPDDGNRYEVIDGELKMTPAPRSIHQKIATEIGFVLSEFVKKHDLGWVLMGPIDVLFAEGDYLEPDVVFVRRERAGIISDRGIEGAPDLVVEVLSDSTAVRDRGIKRERYAWFGVTEYWIVDPDAKQIEVFRMMQNPTEPEIARDSLTWRPWPGAPELTFAVPAVLRGFE